MISEGTDIPRLQVCCHLTRVKTELYFRQVLGRILRVGGDNSKPAYLYIPAEPVLIGYAERIAVDVPNSNTVVTVSINNDKDGGQEPLEIDISQPEEDEEQALNGNSILLPSVATSDDIASSEASDDEFDFAGPPASLADLYDTKLNLFGRFHSRLLHWPSTEHCNRAD